MSQTKVTAYYNTRKRIAAFKLGKEENVTDTLPNKPEVTKTSRKYAVQNKSSKRTGQTATFQVNEQIKPSQLTAPGPQKTKARRNVGKTSKNNIKDAFEAQAKSSKKRIAETESIEVKQVAENAETVLKECSEPQPSTSTEPLVKIKTNRFNKRNNIEEVFEAQKAASKKDELIADDCESVFKVPFQKSAEYDTPSIPKRNLANAENIESPNKKLKSPENSKDKHVAASASGYVTARKKLDLSFDELISLSSPEEKEIVKITKASKKVARKEKPVKEKAERLTKRQIKIGKLKATKQLSLQDVDAVSEEEKGTTSNNVKATKSQKQLPLEELTAISGETEPKPSKTRNVKATKSQKKLGLDAVSENVEAAASIPSTSHKAKESHAPITQKKISHDSTISDARAKILSSGREKELKEKISIFFKQANRVEDLKNNKFLITSLITPASTSSLSSSDDSPTLSTYKAEDAWHRYGSLVSSDITSLCLPYKFTVLFKMFRSADTIVQMLNNRKETCTFEKLKAGVQDMIKRSFTQFNLGQIMTVYPTAYFLRVEKLESGFIQKHGSSDYQLIVMPNLESSKGNGTTMKDSKGKLKNSKNAKIITSQSEPHSFMHMNPSHIIERQEKFTNRLLQITMLHHKNFLSRLCPPVVVPEDKIKRWHKKFLVDNVPDIAAAPLPEPPEVQLSTARDVLNKIKESSNSRVKTALQNVADKYAPVTPESSKSDSSSLGPNTSSTVLKGICSDLLERIRARENAKIIENMTRSTDDTKRAAMMARIPEIVRIVRSYFLVERRTAIALDDVVKKIIDSQHSPLTPDAVKEHLQLISEKLPDWLLTIKIPKGLFLKIDKNKDINVLLDNLSYPR